jgi:hypothetical protein
MPGSASGGRGGGSGGGSGAGRGNDRGGGGGNVEAASDARIRSDFEARLRRAEREAEAAARGWTPSTQSIGGFGE